MEDRTKAQAGPYPLTLLIDGECPLCKREVAWLGRRDTRDRLRFVDIAGADFDPAPYGKTLDELMGSIHAVTAGGETVTGVEVFRRAYRAIGLGWLVAPTAWPILRPIFDALYRAFAKVRPRLQRGGKGANCDTGRCNVG